MSRANPRFRRFNAKLPSPTQNVYRSKVYGQIENQMTISTFWWTDSAALGTASLTHMQNLYNAMVLPAGFLAKYLACLSADFALTEVIIDVPTSPSLAAFTQANTAAGTGPAGHEPSEVAAVIDRYTAFKGQCGRGRVSLPAVPTTWVTASRLTTTTANAAFATQMLAAITSGGDTFTPGLYSHNGSRQQPGAGFAVLSQTVFDTLLGTIRRRKIGRGK